MIDEKNRQDFVMMGPGFLSNGGPPSWGILFLLSLGGWVLAFIFGILLLF